MDSTKSQDECSLETFDSTKTQDISSVDMRVKNRLLGLRSRAISLPAQEALSAKTTIDSKSKFHQVNIGAGLQTEVNSHSFRIQNSELILNDEDDCITDDPLLELKLERKKSKATAKHPSHKHTHHPQVTESSPVTKSIKRASTNSKSFTNHLSDIDKPINERNKHDIENHCDNDPLMELKLERKENKTPKMFSLLPDSDYNQTRILGNDQSRKKTPPTQSNGAEESFTCQPAFSNPVEKHDFLSPLNSVSNATTLGSTNLEQVVEGNQSVARKSFIKRTGQHDSKVSSSKANVSDSLAQATMQESMEDQIEASYPVKPFGRKESKVPPNSTENAAIIPNHSKTKDGKVEHQSIGQTEASYPVKPFGRKESKVPPNTRHTSVVKDSETKTISDRYQTEASYPVKPFGRKESKVPPNSAVNAEIIPSHSKTKDSKVEHQSIGQAEASYPVKPFGRKESKVPPNTRHTSVVKDSETKTISDRYQTEASYPVKPFGRKESKVPPNSAENSEIIPNHSKTKDSKVEHQSIGQIEASYPVKPFGRKESKVPHNNAENAANIPNHSKTKDSKVKHQSIGQTEASYAVKPFGRKESKVPPNSTENEAIIPDDSKAKDSNVQHQSIGEGTYPVKPFGRIESKVPPTTRHTSVVKDSETGTISSLQKSKVLPKFSETADTVTFNYKAESPNQSHSLTLSEAMMPNDELAVSPDKGRFFTKKFFGQNHSKTTDKNEGITCDAKKASDEKKLSTPGRFSFMSRFFSRKPQANEALGVDME